MNKHFENIYYKLYVLFLGVLAFSIPLYDRIAAMAIVLIVFTWLIEGKFKEKLQRIKADRFRQNILWFGLIYILYLFGFLYSKNQYYALLDLQTKLSLLVFPILFATIDENVLKDKKRKILLYYIIGCLVSTIVLLFYSFYNFSESHSVSEFFYSNLSWYQHAGYLSMFLAFAVGILLYHIHVKNIVEKISGPVTIVVIVYFGFFIFLLSSKAGILSLIIILLGYIGVLLYEKQFLKGVTLFLLISLTIWGMFTFFSVTSSRIMDAQQTISSETVENDAKDSTSERIHIWQSAVSVIKENPLFGVGTGDADDALAEYYEINHYSGALEKKLNAHNQYLQTYIAIGIIGLLILLGMIFIPFYMALKQRIILYILLLFLVSFNLLFESMFERQSGVVFYAFFNGLFFFYMFTEKNGH